MIPISIIMPAYNGEAYIRQAIDSLLRQTFKDFELLILDDGSTDRTLDIILDYKDARIQIIHFENNKGIVSVLNEGIKRAKGKYIARMDADDISDAARLERQFQYMEMNADCVVCGSSFTILGTDRVVKLPGDDKEIKLKMLSITPFCHPSVFIRREVLVASNLLYRHRTHCEDIDLWVRLSEHGKFHNIDESLLHYRIHDSNISLKKRTKEELDFLTETQLEYISFFFSENGLTKQETTLIHQLLYGVHFGSAFLVECGQLISKIIKSNKHYMVDAKEVHAYLIKQYFHGCTCSTDNGVKVFWLANQFGYFRIPFILNLKLLVKSLLRYKA